MVMFCRHATYDLSNGVDGRLALLVVSFEPEDEGLERLRPKRLDHEDQCKENCLPAGQECEDRLDGVWLAFCPTACCCHSVPRDLQILHDSVRRLLRLWSTTHEDSLAQ
jgi:hypothetical protein